MQYPYLHKDHELITQSPHGTPNGLAIDFSAKYPPVAGFDGVEVKAGDVHSASPVGESWFEITINGRAKRRIVHAKPTRLGKFKATEVIAEALPYYKDGKRQDHFHEVQFVDGKPGVILDYLDPKRDLDFWIDGGENKWTNEATYVDRQIPEDLNFNDVSMQKVDQLPNMLKLTAVHTADPFNIRLEAKVASKDIGDIPRNHVWFSNVVAYGDSVGGNTKWYQIRVPSGEFAGVVGYCSAAYVKEEPVIVDQTELQQTKAALQNVTQQLNEANTKLSKFKPRTIYELEA